MDGELGERLESILSDPQQMEKLSAMAKELFGQMGGGQAPGDSGQAPANDIPPAAPIGGNAPPAEEARFLSALGRAFSGSGERSRSTALLMAMRPYMKPEKQAKLDRAMQIARMANIAGVVARQFGEGHGV